MKCEICLSRRGYYNYADAINSKGIRCGNCKEVDMINVVSKRCPCDKKKLPSFNYAGLKEKFCVDCKLDNMINVINKKCENCNKRRASFSKINEKKKSLCKSCAIIKNKEVYNIVIKKCKYEECMTPARYNYENTNQAIYCKDHAFSSMIDVRAVVDKCIICREVKATFRLQKIDEKNIIKKATHCRSCVDVLNNKDDFEDVRNKKCSKCLTIRENPKYKPYCSSCYKIQALIEV